MDIGKVEADRARLHDDHARRRHRIGDLAELEH